MAAPEPNEVRCDNCRAIIPFAERVPHRQRKHSRLRQRLYFQALCPFGGCGLPSSSMEVTLLSDRPIIYHCRNGHMFQTDGTLTVV